ncbi:MAG: hypothetical protein SGJ02_01390 [bacterium]|nr:hypothetical protein [bacterium]
MAIASGQLGKMRMIFYYDADLPGIGVSYTPMYNPTSFSVSHAITYDEAQKDTVGDMPKKFKNATPRSLSMELFFDGTGASPSSTDALSNAVNVNTVDIRIQTFLKLAYQINGASHKSSYVMIIWGTFIMTGVLKSANVTYTMFDTNGRPLRAKVNVVVEESVSNSLIGKILKLSSPDLSKAHIVKAGDELALLCFKEYGDASLYTQVAKVNGLKNYRKLKPGMELLFPPINNLV